MTLEQALNAYVNRFTGSSRKSMRQRLKGFTAHVKSLGITVATEITTEHIEQWLVTLCKKRLKPWSVYAYVSAVRQLFATLNKEKYLTQNPWPKHLKTKRPACGMRYVPTKEKMVELLEAASACPYPCRTRAILELGYGCGLRRMELRNLNVEDIEGDTVRIRGKGGKERLVPCGATARQWIDKYVNGERLQAVKANNPLEVALFVSERGNRLSVGSYEIIIRKLRLGGKATGISMHSLRHACATHMLRNGASIVVLQKLLGHSHVTTTEIYTKVTTDDLQAVLAKNHPRG